MRRIGKFFSKESKKFLEFFSTNRCEPKGPTIFSLHQISLHPRSAPAHQHLILISSPARTHKKKESPFKHMPSTIANNRMHRRRSALGLATLLGAAVAVDGLIDGGVVDVSLCDMCSCEGTTNEGDRILVYYNPSAGSRVSV